MGMPTEEELREALSEEARMREQGEDPHHIAKALLNFDYPNSSHGYCAPPICSCAPGCRPRRIRRWRRRYARPSGRSNGPPDTTRTVAWDWVEPRQPVAPRETLIKSAFPLIRRLPPPFNCPV